MINKKNYLGKRPVELGVKDAIHVAIVSVRAGQPIRPGERCKFNEYNEAIPGNGPGVADPHLRSIIPVGQSFWLQLDLDEVPNVSHVWEHPKYSFDAPTREVEKNYYLETYAKLYGVTYEQLIESCYKVAESEEPIPYPGSKTKEEVENEYIDTSDLWYEWAGVSGYEFYNMGTECCPEYDYPGELFTFGE